MVNILAKGTKYLKFRKRLDEDEIYYILCLEPKDYDEFIDDCLIIHCPDTGENNILKFFKELGLDIRRKKEEPKVKEEVKTPEKDLREVQTVIS